ncbi:hypothetical protein HCO47_10745 [Citrobacter braakii]|uniref:hypothetical protein n=1 Tax=Citrobacter braakii TaxID=57706 RepID=UPI0014616843|nr:hypothetical protein [Citrobacter braakii]MBJ9524434.1 hypothetical protein [Citrobacter braakii]MEB0965190.1 hypothetical protein [Citrobacter braakii]NMR48572.1 hypothetical protein [Citrobacter braakii]
MNNLVRELLIKELVAANEKVLKKYDLMDVKWVATFYLDGEEEVKATNILGSIGPKTKN